VITHDLPSGVFEHPLLAGRDWKLRRRIRGRHADLMEFCDGRHGRRIFVKRLHESRASGNDGRLRREYRALQVLQCRLGTVMAHSVPAPIWTHHRDGMLIVSGLDGTPLSRVLKRDANLLTGSVRRRWLSISGDAVGRWLRHFHGATCRGPAPHDHDKFCHDLDAALGRLAERAGRTHGLDEVLVRLTGASRRLAGSPLATAAGHGDFLPQNVLIRRHNAAVVDFEGYRRRAVVHRDAGSMLAYTMMLGRQPGYQAAALRVFAAAFESAYGELLREDAQRLFTAEAAVRIARDSANPRTHGIMLDLVAALVPEQEST
jgi:Ser/Thr protein kinase RdoA (MazF antagonist)